MILGLIKNALGALGAVFRYVTQRDAEKNAPAMQANAAAQTEAEIKAKVAAAEAAAEKGDISEAQRLSAE